MKKMDNGDIEEFFKSLRSGTSESHQKLEETPLSVNLMSPSATVDNYCDYLRAMREVISFTELVIFPQVGSVVPDLNARGKFSGITEDLAELEQRHVKGSASPVFFPALNLTVPVALGFLYVVEGSTLGGRVIYKHLQKQGILADNASARFFNGYGDNTGALWKSFMQVLGRYTVSNSCQDGVISGAKVGFDSIYNHFVSIG